MEFQKLLLLVGLLASPGCERARTLAETVRKFKPPPTPAVQTAKVLVTNLSENELGRFCRQRGTLTIVEYYANWKGESMQLVPVLNSVTEEFGGRVLVGKINIDTSAKLAESQGVKSIPDVRFYSDGVLVDRFVGLPDNDEIRDRIAAQVKNLPVATPQEIKPATPPPTVKQGIKPVKDDPLPPGLRRR